MSNFKFKALIVASLMLIQPILSTGSYALAKRRTPPKAFSFIAEGGKASQGECDGERKIPRLKRLKEYSGASSYMGSELQDPEIKGKPGDEMWKHFFRAKPACNSVLAKTPSSVNDNLAKAKSDASTEEDSEEAAENADEQQQIENAEAEPATE